MQNPRSRGVLRLHLLWEIASPCGYLIIAGRVFAILEMDAGGEPALKEEQGAFW
jgi:hypothetical protein